MAKRVIFLTSKVEIRNWQVSLNTFATSFRLFAVKAPTLNSSGSKDGTKENSCDGGWNKEHCIGNCCILFKPFAEIVLVCHFKTFFLC